MWWRMRSSSFKTCLEILFVCLTGGNPKEKRQELESSSLRLFLKRNFVKVVILLPALPTQRSGSSHVWTLILWPWRGTQTALGVCGLMLSLRPCGACSLPQECPVPGLRLQVPESWAPSVDAFAFDGNQVFQITESKRSQSCVMFCTAFFSSHYLFGTGALFQLVNSFSIS